MKKAGDVSTIRGLQGAYLYLRNLASDNTIVSERISVWDLYPQIPLHVLLFEAISAFGTVGMSLGVTPELSPAGKVLMAILMFIGRVGPLTIAFALAKGRKKPHIKYAEEKIMIG